MTGSHEVRGSIPLGSTNHFNKPGRTTASDLNGSSVLVEL